MFFKIITKILMPCFIAIVAVFGFWFLFSAQKENNAAENNNSLMSIFKEETGEKTKLVGGELSSVSAQTKKYENSQYGFSFNYPIGFKASEFPEEEGRISLIIQNEKMNQIFQIYITPFNDENFEVTSERIKRDIPNLPFSNSAAVIVGGKAKGVAFFSQNEVFGETAEVWFAKEGYFYQATAYRKNVGLLEVIIKSWEFRK